MKLSNIPVLGSIIARRDVRIWGQAIESYKTSILAADEAIPQIELPARHLINCKIVPDRIAMLNELPKGGRWCEVGTAAGEFAEQILTISCPDMLHLVDSWSSEHDVRYANMEDAVKQRLQGKPIAIHRGNSTDVLVTFQDDYFDVIYLDTGHEYPNTVVELELCRQKVKQGGLIAGHDYVTGSWRSLNRYGVVEAVNEFCIKHNWEFIMVTWECHRHLSYVLKKI